MRGHETKGRPLSTNRQPAGTSIGGQWAAGAASEVDDSLEPTGATDLSYRDMSVGQTERFDSRTWVSKTGNGLAVLTLDDDGGGTTTRYYVTDDRATDDSHLGDSHADQVASRLYGGRGLSQVDHTDRGLTPGNDADFEDPWRVNNHLVTWAPASQGRVGVHFGDDRMREIGAGGHRFADSEKMEVANNFITAYEQNAMLASRIPPLTDEQRQARIDVVRTTNDEFDMNQAADDLELDDRLHRTPFDASRPPLHVFDPSSPASHEAVSKSSNGANAFAHTSDLDGNITQIFSLVDDNGRMKTKTESLE